MLNSRHFAKLLERVVTVDPLPLILWVGERIVGAVNPIVIGVSDAIVYDRHGAMRPIFAWLIDERRKRRHDPGWLE